MVMKKLQVPLDAQRCFLKIGKSVSALTVRAIMTAAKDYFYGNLKCLVLPEFVKVIIITKDGGVVVK